MEVYRAFASSRMTTPFLSSTTRLRISLTMSSSCVAITTVVPFWLILSSTPMMPMEVVGSRFPVGSSASRMPDGSRRRGRSPRAAARRRRVRAEPVFLAFKAHGLQDLGDGVADDAAALADDLHGEGDVGEDGFLRQQAEVLEDDADSRGAAATRQLEMLATFWPAT